MGLLDYYKQFEGDDRRGGLRASCASTAQERSARRSSGSSRSTSRATTWHEFPHPDVVAAVTYEARRGINRYADPHAAPLRREIAIRNDRRGRARGRPATAPPSCSPPRRTSCSSPATSWSRRGRRTRSTRSWPAAPARRPCRSPATTSSRSSARSPATRAWSSLCNPNDPTGQLPHGRSHRRAAASACPSGSSSCSTRRCATSPTPSAPTASVDLLDDHARLLIVRTFSKAYGLAGLRAGYALGGPGSEALLEHFEPPLGDERPGPGRRAARRCASAATWSRAGASGSSRSARA